MGGFPVKAPVINGIRKAEYYFSRGWFYLTGIVGQRDDDIVLASFPRAGSTWVRYILFNILRIEEGIGGEASINQMDEVMPRFGRYDLTKSWPYKTLPRFVKTHHSYQNLLFPRFENAIYLVRDPRDIMVSYFEFTRSQHNEHTPAEFSMFIRHPKKGLEAFFRNYRSWKSKTSHLLQYEKLKANPVKEIKSLLEKIEADVSNLVIQEAVKASSFKKMKEKQEQYGVKSPGLSDGKIVTIRKGKIHQWTDYFSPQDKAYYQELAQQYHFELY